MRFLKGRFEGLLSVCRHQWKIRMRGMKELAYKEAARNKKKSIKITYIRIYIVLCWSF